MPLVKTRGKAALECFDWRHLTLLSKAFGETSPAPGLRGGCVFGSDGLKLGWRSLGWPRCCLRCGSHRASWSRRRHLPYLPTLGCRMLRLLPLRNELRKVWPSGRSGGWCRVGVVGAVRRLLRARPHHRNRVVPLPEESRSTSRPPPPGDRTRPPVRRSLHQSLSLKPSLHRLLNCRLNPLPPRRPQTTGRWSLRRTSYSPSPFWQPHVNTSWS
jgi:hypothetical protein